MLFRPSAGSMANKNMFVSPTPYPYEDMTIPYLRKRTYASSLTERTEPIDHGTYTSYITSYDSDGLRIQGLLTVPNEDPPPDGFPAIVFIHGYIPPASYETRSRYGDHVDYLARSGYVVFKIDLRGHGSSEGQATGAYYSSGYVIDTIHAYHALQGADEVNPDAIGLWGHSMGGNIAMRTVATLQNVPAAVIWAGAVFTYEDMATYGIQDTSYVRPAEGSPAASRRRRIFDEKGEFLSTDPFWRQVVPINYLSDVRTKVALHHAQDDDVVSIAYSRNLVEQAQKQRFPILLTEHQTGGHNIAGYAFNSAMEETVAFFDSHLTPAPEANLRVSPSPSW